MLSRPKWFKKLRNECRPAPEKVKPLESLRQHFNIPHEVFCMRVMSSSSSTRQLQKHLLGVAKKELPHSNEKELWKIVLRSRLRKYIEFGFESAAKLEEIDEVLREAKSFDEVCDYIISLDEQEPSFPDPMGIGKMIDNILKE